MSETDTPLQAQPNAQPTQPTAPAAGGTPEPTPLTETVRAVLLKCKLDKAAARIPSPEGPQRVLSFGEVFRRLMTRWTFKGRAARSEYWGVIGPYILFDIGLQIIEWLFNSIGCTAIVSFFKILGGTVDCVIAIPVICLTARRLHDVGRGFGSWFIILIPIYGWKKFLDWMAKQGDPETNKFGPVPNLR